MTLRVVFLPRADQDLAEHVEHIAHDNLDAALRLHEAVHRAVDRLADHPNIGVERTFAQTRLAGLRMWPVPDFTRYVIFYQAKPSAIVVVRVVHSARDVPGLLG